MRRIWSALKFATPTARALPDFTASKAFGDHTSMKDKPDRKSLLVA